MRLAVCEKCASQMMHRGPRLRQMKFELASRNTQQDKTTTLNHDDGRDVGSLQMEPKMFHKRNRMLEAPLFSPAMTNTPHEGALEETERGRRAATCKITIELTIYDGRGTYRGHRC